MKKMNLKEKGITIISLVVTIIILLILAGVSIRVVSGDNGLFRKAKEVVEESKKAEYQEELSIIGLGIRVGNGTTKISSKEYVDLFEEEMNKQIVGNTIFKESKVRRKNDETLRIETKEGYIYYVREDETIYIGKAGEVDESEVPDITMGDIKFKYSTKEWTNEDVTVEITIGEEVENRENYIIEYSKDAKNWTRYKEAVPMTENGEIYARAKDKLGDIKVEKYATGEVQNIDKNAPIAGTIIIREEVIDGPIYIGETETPRNLFIEMENGMDNENESGYKSTVYNISGPITLESCSESMLLTKEGIYTITVITEDIAGNTSAPRTYLINISKFDENGWAKDTVKIYEQDGEYWVPEGFKIAEDSGTKVNEGIVVEDRSGNQYVWIPCTIDGSNGSLKYDRYDFMNIGNVGTDSATNSLKILYTRDEKENYAIEKLEENEKSSIEKYNGYYIGRYETGDKESTEARKMRGSDSSTTNTITIKKGQAPYNNVTLTSAQLLASNMSEKENYNGVITKITSSYAYDTAMKFITNHSRYSGYATSYSIGNYKRNSFSYTDITNVARNKSSDQAILVPTGQTERVVNIYDMVENVFEFTTEVRPIDGVHVIRGGYYDEWDGTYDTASSYDVPPGGKNVVAGSVAYAVYGFRISMYISP